MSLLVGDETLIDYVLPAGVALIAVIEDLLPRVNDILRKRGAPELDDKLTYRLCRTDATPLDVQRSLDDSGVLDGEVLWLLPADATERFAQTVEEVSTALARSADQQFRRRGRDDEPTGSRRAGGRAGGVGGADAGSAVVAATWLGAGCSLGRAGRGIAGGGKGFGPCSRRTAQCDGDHAGVVGADRAGCGRRDGGARPARWMASGGGDRRRCWPGLSAVAMLTGRYVGVLAAATGDRAVRSDGGGGTRQRLAGHACASGGGVFAGVPSAGDLRPQHRCHRGGRSWAVVSLDHQPRHFRDASRWAAQHGVAGGALRYRHGGADHAVGSPRYGDRDRASCGGPRWSWWLACRYAVQPQIGGGWRFLVFTLGICMIFLLRSRSFVDRYQSIDFGGRARWRAPRWCWAATPAHPVPASVPVTLICVALALALGIAGLLVALVIPKARINAPVNRAVEVSEYVLLILVVPWSIWLLNLLSVVRNAVHGS